LTFYSPQDALDFLKAKTSELFRSRGLLQEAYGRAIVARSKAKTPELVSKADQLVQDLAVSIGDQASLESKVRYVVPDSWIPQNLGLFPLVIAGVGAVAVAGAVYLHLQRVAQHRDTLALIEKGILTPAQAITLEQSSPSLLGVGGLSGMFGGLGSLAIGGAALYLLFLVGPMFKRGR
jgi:hypothetical protein